MAQLTSGKAADKIIFTIITQNFSQASYMAFNVTLYNIELTKYRTCFPNTEKSYQLFTLSAITGSLPSTPQYKNTLAHVLSAVRSLVVPKPFFKNPIPSTDSIPVVFCISHPRLFFNVVCNVTQNNMNVGLGCCTLAASPQIFFFS